MKVSRIIPSHFSKLRMQEEGSAVEHAPCFVPCLCPQQSKKHYQVSVASSKDIQILFVSMAFHIQPSFSNVMSNDFGKSKHQ